MPELSKTNTLIKIEPKLKVNFQLTFINYIFTQFKNEWKENLPDLKRNEKL